MGVEESSAKWPTRFFSSENPPPDRYAEGYKAGRIATLREVGCSHPVPELCGMFQNADGTLIRCRGCRLLAEAESGEQEREVGGEG